MCPFLSRTGGGRGIGTVESVSSSSKESVCLLVHFFLGLSTAVSSACRLVPLVPENKTKKSVSTCNQNLLRLPSFSPYDSGSTELFSKLDKRRTLERSGKCFSTSACKTPFAVDTKSECSPSFSICSSVRASPVDCRLMTTHLPHLTASLATLTACFTLAAMQRYLKNH